MSVLAWRRRHTGATLPAFDKTRSAKEHLLSTHFAHYTVSPCIRCYRALLV